MATPATVDIVVTAHPKRLATMIAPWRPDLIVCAAFPWIIPADVLAIPPLGVLNAHDSLLPKYRGPNATGCALRKGEAWVFTSFAIRLQVDSAWRYLEIATGHDAMITEPEQLSQLLLDLAV